MRLFVVYDDDVRMECIAQEGLHLDNTVRRPGGDLVVPSALRTWERFTGLRFALGCALLDRKEDALYVASAYSQEYLTASSAPALVDEGATKFDSRACSIPLSVDYLLAMFVTLELGTDVGLPEEGPACPVLPQELIMSAD